MNSDIRIRTDLDRQMAFVTRLRSGYVLTEVDIRETYNIRKVPEFVDRVIERTELDIVKARLTLFGEEQPAYYITGVVHPETAGLQEMSVPAEPVECSMSQAPPKSIEYRKGYYVMWSCPNVIDGDVCSQFHKVDLGDEPLDGVRNVRCTKCGKLYEIAGGTYER